MGYVTTEQLHQRLKIMKTRCEKFKELAAQNGGKLRLYEWWQRDYTSRPYLLGCPDDRLAIRFRDVFINETELTKEGKIGLIPNGESTEFIAKFTHLQEEYSLRGGGATKSEYMWGFSQKIFY